MIERRFTRSNQPATIFLGGRELSALDWSPEGFRLGTGLSHGYQGKWYPIKMIVTSPDNPVILEGKAQARWSSALESGFIFKLEHDEAANETKSSPSVRGPDESAAPSLDNSIIYESKRPSLAGVAKGTKNHADHPYTELQEPPVLTQIVQNGVLKKSQKNKYNPLEKSQFENKLKTNVTSLAGFKTVKILAHTSGTIVVNHLKTGSTINKNAIILTFTNHEGEKGKASLLKQQAAEKAKLEAIQSELIRCDSQSKSIDADSGENLASQSRKKVATALVRLNHAHELQKGCKAPFQHYQKANVEYRKSRQVHQKTIENLDTIGAQCSLNQLTKIQDRTNQLRQNHSKTINRLRKISEQLTQLPEARTSTIYSPFSARVKAHSVAINQSFNRGETLTILETISSPILEVLIPKDQALAISASENLTVKLPKLGISMSGKVSKITKIPDHERGAMVAKGITGEKPQYVAQIGLEQGFNEVADYDNIKDQPATIYWPHEQ